MWSGRISTGADLDSADPATFDADKVGEFGSDSPMGGAGQPAEVAPAFIFLACEDSSYMTGQVLHPNGGEIIGGVSGGKW